MCGANLYSVVVCDYRALVAMDKCWIYWTTPKCFLVDEQVCGFAKTESIHLPDIRDVWSWYVRRCCKAPRRVPSVHTVWG